MAYIDIRFNLEEVKEEDDSYYEFTSVEFKGSDIPQSARERLVETLAQSDKYYIEITADILEELGK